MHPRALAPTQRTAHAHTPVPATRIDRWFDRVRTSAVLSRVWTWGGPVVVLTLAAILRLWNLGHPHELIFDETYYVKDAYTLLNNGYESSWPDEPDARFESGDTDIFSDAAAYVVHPPLGKWGIALGIAAFGVDSSVGWRISTALLGIIAVGLVMLIARILFRSRLLTLIAGGLLAVDGHAIVMSRVAILDTSLMALTLLGFVFVLLDQVQSNDRLAVAAARARSRLGPVLWWRPWLVAAGAAFGAATAVKWSGLYFLAAFGLYVVGSDLLRRQRLGVPRFALGALLRQGPVSFVLLVPVAAAVYLASWTGWFLTDGGFNRSWAESPGNAWTGPFSWIPGAFQSLVDYHRQMYLFHVGLSTPHTYAADPLGWTLLVRPTSMYYRGTASGEGVCTIDACSSAITSIGNPLIWWTGTAAILYLFYRYVRYRNWSHGFILMGIVAGYLPWLLYRDRTVFQFYSITFEPYIILAIVACIGLIVRRPWGSDPRRGPALAALAVYIGAIGALSAFWYPLWTGTTVSKWFWGLHIWFESWR